MLSIPCCSRSAIAPNFERSWIAAAAWAVSSPPLAAESPLQYVPQTVKPFCAASVLSCPWAESRESSGLPSSPWP